MSDSTGLIYRYDGTFFGMMCCVYESYYSHEIPEMIVSIENNSSGLFGEKFINTDDEKAERVLRSIPLKISEEAAKLVRLAYFSCLPEKELAVLNFLRTGYRIGRKIMLLEELNEVQVLKKAVQHLLSEAHLLKGFVRFSEYKAGGESMLVSVIGPKNFVLPFIADHFRLRFPGEYWLIYDEVHGVAAVGKLGRVEIVPLDDLQLAAPNEDEMKYRAMWRKFYDTIEIKPRHNERCRMTLLPKRYWKYMTEFVQEGSTLIRELPGKTNKIS